jgi:hypothetical protein
MSPPDKASVKKVHALEEDILNRSDAIVRVILEYMRVLGSTGIKTPTPPRPKHEEVARVGYAAILLEAAFKAMKGN